MRSLVSFVAALAIACLSTASAAAAQPSVLVLPFAVNAAPESASQLEKDMSSLLRQSLAKQGFRVLSAEEAKRAGATAATQDPGKAAALGKTAKADFVAYGTFSQVGQSISLDVRLVDVASKRLRPYYAERKSLLELPGAVESLAVQAYAGATGQNTLADVQVRGLRVLDPDRILVRLKTRPGDAINVDAVDEDVRRIWDMGYFSDVKADVEQTGQGDVLVFTVAEKPRIDDVRVEGSDAVKKADILEAMTSRTGTVLNENVLAQDLQKVTDLYRKKGYYLAKVNYETLVRADGTSAALVLHVEEGNRLYIKEVAIEGLENIRRKDLDDYLALKKRTLLSWFTGSGVLKEDLLERDTQAIQAYAVNLGYITAQVSAPEVIYEPDGIRVIYRVREGARFKLGEIGFGGELIDTEAHLFDLIKLDEQREDKEYFSLDVVQGDIKKLTEFYNDQGYAFAVVNLDTREDKDNAIIDITFMLDPKERVHIRRVELEGNTKTRDNVILREMRLADGQQFSGDLLRRSTERLEKLRYFSEVDPQLVPTGTPGEVDLKMGVKEDNTGMLNVGFGYSTYDKFGVSGGIQESNLFGRGYQIGLQGYLSGRDNNLNATFYNPRLYDTNLGLALSAYILDEEWTDFDKKTIGGGFVLSYPIGEYTSVFLGYRLDFYDIRNVSPWAAPSIREYIGENWASVVSAGVRRDTTNKPLLPTRGTKTNLVVEYGGGGIGGDDNFVKPIVDWGVFYGLNDTNILHLRASAGAVFRNTGKPVPAFERFYLGGMRSIRGYSIEDISPRDPVTGERIGGDRMAFANLEYIWAFEPDLGLSLVPFFDIGSSIDSARQNLFDALYYSAGVELRWRSPMGDLRFAYGFPLTDNVDGQRRTSGRFEFTMGQAF